MAKERPDILEALKFGELIIGKIFFCEECGKIFDEFDDCKMADRFGRCFCSPKCRAKYYDRD
ncbi:MAG: hypothetical protein IKB32_04125 [Clostridia bacterium]|nr:hypothetical protein [Clostridia bacterium]